MVHGTVNKFFRLLEVLAFSLVVATALTAWRLSKGPVNLDVLNPYLEEALSDPQGAYHVALEHTLLTWAGWERALDLRATGVQVVSRRKGVVATVPELSLTLSGSALSHGVVAPHAVEVFGARLRLFRDADGRVHWGIGGPAVTDPETVAPPATAETVRQLYRDIVLQPDADTPLAHLARLRLVDAELVVEDAQLGLDWRAPDVDALLMRRDGGLFGETHVAVDFAGQRLELDGTVSHRVVDGDFTAEMQFRNLRPHLFAAIGGPLAPLQALALPLHGSVDARFTLENGLDGLTFDIGSGAGELRLPAPVATDYPVFGLHLEGRVDAAAPRRLTIEDLFIDMGGPTVSAAALVEQEADGTLVLRGEVGADNVLTDDLPRYWPQQLGPKPRKWVVQNLTDGIVTHASMTLAARYQPDGAFVLESLDGEILPEGVTVAYLRPMPPVRNTSARVRFDHNSFTIHPTGGELRDLRVTGGTILFTALDTNDEQAAIDLRIEGPLVDALTVLDSPPLGYPAKLGIVPGTARGRAVTDLHLAFPLISWLKLDDLEVLAKAELSDVALPKVLMGLDLSRGDLKLAVTTKSMEVSGPVRLGSMAAKLAWQENFTSQAPFSSRYKLQGVVNEAQRRELGLDVIPFVSPWLSGPVKADVDVTLRGGGNGTVAAQLDLAEAGMELPGLGWRKLPGVPGKAQVEVKLARQRLAAIPRFKVEAGSPQGDGALTTEGAVQFVDGEARVVQFDTLRYGRSDLAGTLTLRGAAGLDIAVHGASFDAAPVLRSAPPPAPPPQAGAQVAAATGEDDPLPPMTIVAKLDRLWLGDKAQLPRVDLGLNRDGTNWRTARLQAWLDSGMPVTMSMAPIDGRRSFTITSDDAGGVFRAMDIFDDISGGRMLVLGDITGSARDETITGKAEVVDYHVVKAPVLAQILSVAAITGIGNVMSGQGIAFSTLDAPFVLRDGLLKINDAVAAGTELGITARGEIDLRDDRVAVEGTLVPIYAFNSILGNIPLIGQLLTDGKGGGVFAATFEVEGRGSKPDVTVNPLAALTPGVLRRFFALFGDGVDDLRVEGRGPEK